MKLADRIKTNCRKPRGFFGRRTIAVMNERHRSLHEWGLSKMELADGMDVLDVGCGGGTVISMLLALLPSSRVFGLDYSEVSVALAKKENAAAVQAGRCEISMGDIAALPYGEGAFDVVTSFENYYFWDDFEKCASEILRVLRPGGRLYIIGDDHNTGKPNPQMEHYVEIMNMKYLTADSLKKLLTDCGFSEVTVETEADGRIFAAAGK